MKDQKRKWLRSGASTFEYILITAVTIVLGVILARGLSPGSVKVYERFCDLVAGDSGRSGVYPSNINIGR